MAAILACTLFAIFSFSIGVVSNHYRVPVSIGEMPTSLLVRTAMIARLDIQVLLDSAY